MDTDIQDEIDRSFDEGPPIDDLDLLLDRGRAAVRRRRLTEGASLLLVAGVVTVIALVSTGGTSESSSPDPAGTSTATPTATPSSPPMVPDDQSDLVTPEDEWPGQVDQDLVEFADGGTQRLQPSGSATILEQRAHPNLPDSFATPKDRSAVAEVELDGQRWYVLARHLEDGSPPQYTAVSANDGGATLDDFLAMARERYDEGGGGLL